MALQEFYKVDLKTGNIIDVCLFDVDKKDKDGNSIPVEIPNDCFLGWGERQMYNPVYDFKLNDWVDKKPQEEILQEVKSAKVLELNSVCEMAIFEPFQATNGHFYSFELKDQLNFTQMSFLINSNPHLTDIQWKTEDAGVLLHTREEFLEVIASAEVHKMGNISKNWQLKGLVESAETVEEVQAITW